MENSDILYYIKEYLPSDLKLIERSMINYYSLKNNKNNTAEKEELREMIFNGVLNLFDSISTHLHEITGEDEEKLKAQLKEIFIKT